MTTNPDLTIPGTDERAIANRDVLAADTAMGPVTLLVGDLDALTNYYVEGLALTVLSAEGSRTVLGRGSTPIIVLQHDPTLPRGSRRDAGLFHTAILFEDPGALAAAVGSLADRKSTRLNSSHVASSYAVFCLKKKRQTASVP